MLSDKKAEKYYEEGKVFPLINSDAYNMYGVEGKTGVWNVRIDKLTGNVSCTCKNVRHQWDCSHMKAVKIYDKNKKGRTNTDKSL